MPPFENRKAQFNGVIRRFCGRYSAKIRYQQNYTKFVNTHEEIGKIYMQELVFIIHILAAIFLIVLILMQHGKGADMGAAFGSGASQTVFGSIGTVPFLTKITAIVAIVFCVTSLGLGFFISQQVKQERSVVSGGINTNLSMPIASVPTPAADSTSTTSSAAAPSKSAAVSDASSPTVPSKKTIPSKK